MTNRALLVSTFAPCLVATARRGGMLGRELRRQSAAREKGTGGGGPAISSLPSDDAARRRRPARSEHRAPRRRVERPADGSSAPAAGTERVPDGAGDELRRDAALPGWTLTWSDEFNGPDGTAVDPTKWKHDVGGTGWGNNELEYYTDGMQNAVVQGGNLVITATTQGASQYKCSYGTCKYTSARLLTQGLFSQQYGRFEARAQMPTGKGLWPAIWALGDNISTVSWPACGEIDFMETIGTDIKTNHGSLHMPNELRPLAARTSCRTARRTPTTSTCSRSSGSRGRFASTSTTSSTRRRPRRCPSGDTWEFEHPFFLLINVAVGGQWPGSPDGTTTFPQTLKVDWVRVYQKDGTEP